jgi:hypothetical protein
MGHSTIGSVTCFRHRAKPPQRPAASARPIPPRRLAQYMPRLSGNSANSSVFAALPSTELSMARTAADNAAPPPTAAPPSRQPSSITGTTAAASHACPIQWMLSTESRPSANSAR